MTEFSLETLALRGTTQEQMARFRAAVDVVEPHWIDGPWIAGGSIRRLITGQDPLGSDVDVFFANDVQKDTWLARMLTLGGASVKYANDMNTTLEVPLAIQVDPEGDVETINLKLQAIHVGYYPSPDAVIDSFDYTICQLITDGETVGAGKFTLWDLGRKRLVLHRVTYAVATMRRMLKYTNQGFYACSGMMNDLLRTVAERPELINTEIAYID